MIIVYKGLIYVIYELKRKKDYKEAYEINTEDNLENIFNKLLFIF